MWLAAVFMLAILFFLGSLLYDDAPAIPPPPPRNTSNPPSLLLPLRYSQYQLDTQSVGEFWLLQFPFQLHCGWIVAASAVQLNTVVVAYDGSSETQLSMAILSVAGVVATALYLLFVLEKKIETTAGVQAWALMGIASQLADPFEKTQVKFGSLVLDGLGGAANIASTALWVMVGLAVVWEVYMLVAGRREKVQRETGLPMQNHLEAPLTAVSTV